MFKFLTGSGSRKAPGKPPVAPCETMVKFESLQQWMEWSAANPHMFDPALLDAVASRIRANGFIEPLTGKHASPRAIKGAGNQLREGFDFKGVKSRERAVLRVIEEHVDPRLKDTLRVYSPEAVTKFAGRIRHIFPNFTGSEFTADFARRARMGRIRFEDLTRLSFDEQSFDLVVTNEVLEHVPDIDTALSEIRRVLVAGGWHIGTHPFRFMGEDSQIRARLRGSEIEHLMPAEYHVNPFEAGGSLVFEIPGWDILERCRAVGFSDATMYYCASERHGFIAEYSGGVFVLACRR